MQHCCAGSGSKDRRIEDPNAREKQEDQTGYPPSFPHDLAHPKKKTDGKGEKQDSKDRRTSVDQPDVGSHS